MKHIPFELSHRDESNGGKIIEIQSLDADLLQRIFKYSLWVNFINIDATDMKYLPFKSFHCDESTDGKNIEI